MAIQSGFFIGPPRLHKVLTICKPSFESKISRLFMEEKSFDLPTQSYRGRVPQQLIFKTIAGDVEIWLIVFGLPLRTETNDEAPLAEGLETDLTVGLGATFGREELIGGRS
ncbi:hypothetical protein Tco_1066248 [Tanacetum coccineum]|uniref:Uncharacterized protein n=1 Tax=Tanacetum coccineum TaxID=301880 RepID=A0ABQ5H9I8_9ASTR